jgi:hypothetical protein
MRPRSSARRIVNSVMLGNAGCGWAQLSQYVAAVFIQCSAACSYLSALLLIL